ncbi:MAG: UDP-glucose 4-epimerase GalE [Alphaproteobacteria bacterium]|nr:UDP-glucose 4-epimerase GalE [Alphaproteobacteria bacterium]
MSAVILISGGAGYIGSHAAYGLKQAGYEPVILDNLSTGNEWAARHGILERGDVGDGALVRGLCEKYQPAAAMHFAAFIEVGESVQNPDKYFDNNRDKAMRFFRTLNECGVNKVVFSSTAAVYGDSGGNAPIEELNPTHPINPYGQSKLEAEAFLRMLDAASMRSVVLRYFNVAGAGPADSLLGEAHFPETHLIPRLILPLIDAPLMLLQGLGLQKGFTIYGNDYPTPDGTAIRDYIHVMDLVDAHIRALDYLLKGGATDIFNLGSNKGFSVQEIVDAVRTSLNKSYYKPGIAPRREGDPAFLVASNAKAGKVLGWSPARPLGAIIGDAVTWHRSPRYIEAMRAKIGKTSGIWL